METRRLVDKTEAHLRTYYPVRDRHTDCLSGKVTISEKSATCTRDFSESKNRLTRCVGSRQRRFLVGFTPIDGRHGISSVTAPIIEMMTTRTFSLYHDQGLVLVDNWAQLLGNVCPIASIKRKLN